MNSITKLMLRVGALP